MLTKIILQKHENSNKIDQLKITIEELLIKITSQIHAGVDLWAREANQP
jgi:hypothetical protein